MIKLANPGHIGHLEMLIVTWAISNVLHFILVDTWKYPEKLVMSMESIRQKKHYYSWKQPQKHQVPHVIVFCVGGAVWNSWI